jgi:hypothetical protein
MACSGIALLLLYFTVSLHCVIHEQHWCKLKTYGMRIRRCVLLRAERTRAQFIVFMLTFGRITLVYKIFFFSVTSTKVVELNSIFYAEYKYVLSFSLSRKVFKWHTVIIWRKLTFTCYISVFLHYLKNSCGWFSALCRLWNISLEGPAVVSQHTEAPLALVSLFHIGNVLMKSLSVLITDGAKILREEV